MFQGRRIGFQNGGWSQAISNSINRFAPMAANQRNSGRIGFQNGGWSQAISNSINRFAPMAAPGGRVGRMGGGIMIASNNGVENNGIGAILKKYKQIRSEL